MISSLKLLTLCIIILTFPSLALAAKTHRVKKNETVYSLSKKYHVSVQELKSANNLVRNRLKARQLLVIPPRTVAAAPASAGASVYRVKKSETLSRVSRKTGVSVSELKRLNGLRSSRVKSGKLLVLRERAQEDENRPKVARRLHLRHNDFFSEKENEYSLQSELGGEPSVDLKKSTELKVGFKGIQKSAYDLLDTPYSFGGNSSGGIDCSAFVQTVFRKQAVPLPRTAREQFEVGSVVAQGDLQKGDLIFFSTYRNDASHVGIYLGNNMMIHASSRGGRVVVSSMDTDYYRSRYLGAKRVSKRGPTALQLDDLMAGVEEDNSDYTIQEDALDLTQRN